MLLALVVLAAAGGVALYGWAAERVRHAGALADYAGRPPPGKGTNWLLIGSDSRAALSPEQRKDLHVGNDTVRNTDTIMVLHSGRHGPYLVSLPRDSYVRVPGHGRAKINAAYAQGGPRLLARTVEQATGLRVDRYAEVNCIRGSCVWTGRCAMRIPGPISRRAATGWTGGRRWLSYGPAMRTRRVTSDG